MYIIVVSSSMVIQIGSISMPNITAKFLLNLALQRRTMQIMHGGPRKSCIIAGETACTVSCNEDQKRKDRPRPRAPSVSDAVC